MQQQHSINDFSSADSWVILSEIELSIKRKIEAVGTPLKDWDIQIYRGVLTGYNEAFIISTEKRDKILANCQNEEERAKTAELIRPILRGRDIKRYGYDWAGLWLINTHNGVKGVKPRIDINDYPAVKQHLDKYWDKISKRADKGDTPYNLRNCAYVDDFNQPKIIYIEIQTDNPNDGYPFPCFSFDENNSVILNTGYIMCSKSVDCRYVLGLLNSSVGKFISKLYVSQLQERQFRMLAQYVSKFPLPNFNQHIKEAIINLVQQRLETGNDEIEHSIDDYICSLFEFSQEEIKVIQMADN